MVEKIKTVKNPLTIIAIFAALSEICSTAVLPLLSIEIQWYFMWFVIIFPVLLLLLFFYTLNTKHFVLYAPSDYKDESNYLKTFGKADDEQVIKKISSEYSNDSDSVVLSNIPDRSAIPDKSELRELNRAAKMGKRLIAEKLVFAKLEKYLGAEFRQEVRLQYSTGNDFIFDGIAVKDGKFYAVEIKHVDDFNRAEKLVRNSLLKINETYLQLPTVTQNEFNLILAITTENPEIDPQILKHELLSSLPKMKFNIEVKVYKIDFMRHGVELKD